MSHCCYLWCHKPPKYVVVYDSGDPKKVCEEHLTELTPTYHTITQIEEEEKDK